MSVPVIGFDALPEALQAIQDGTMAATIEQFPGRPGDPGDRHRLAKFATGPIRPQHDTYLTPILITAENLGEAERAVEAGVAPAASPEASPSS